MTAFGGDIPADERKAIRPCDYAGPFEAVKGDSVTALERYYGDEFVVDETM